jgi:hypothetical protein
VHPVIVLQLLALLVLANGTPVVAKKILGNRLSYPLDGNVGFLDGRPLFGRSKTIRGVVLGVLAAVAGALVAAPRTAARQLDRYAEAGNCSDDRCAGRSAPTRTNPRNCCLSRAELNVRIHSAPAQSLRTIGSPASAAVADAGASLRQRLEYPTLKRAVRAQQNLYHATKS